MSNSQERKERKKEKEERDGTIKLEHEMDPLNTIHFNRPEEEKGLLCQRWRRSCSRNIMKGTDISLVGLLDLLLTLVNFMVKQSAHLV